MEDFDRPGCLSCDLNSGREEAPGGLIAATEHWRVDHCVGPLGIGSLIVRPARHVVRLSELTAAESGELGSVLARSAQVVDALTGSEQTYACLWSHAGRVPGHIHFVVQPATSPAIEAHDGQYGPALQLAMFTAGARPDPIAVEEFAARARERSSAMT